MFPRRSFRLLRILSVQFFVRGKRYFFQFTNPECNFTLRCKSCLLSGSERTYENVTEDFNFKPVSSIHCQNFLLKSNAINENENSVDTNEKFEIVFHQENVRVKKEFKVPGNYYEIFIQLLFRNEISLQLVRITISTVAMCY